MGLLRDLGTPTEAAEYDGNKARIVALCNVGTGRSGRPANGPPASYRRLTMILILNDQNHHDRQEAAMKLTHRVTSIWVSTFP